MHGRRPLAPLVKDRKSSGLGVPTLTIFSRHQSFSLLILVCLFCSFCFILCLCEVCRMTPRLVVHLEVYKTAWGKSFITEANVMKSDSWKWQVPSALPVFCKRGSISYQFVQLKQIWCNTLENSSGGFCCQESDREKCEIDGWFVGRHVNTPPKK